LFICAKDLFVEAIADQCGGLGVGEKGKPLTSPAAP
jgi:hypothetical protein